jgi:hypothetical protein
VLDQNRLHNVYPRKVAAMFCCKCDVSLCVRCWRVRPLAHHFSCSSVSVLSFSSCIGGPTENLVRDCVPTPFERTSIFDLF